MSIDSKDISVIVQGPVIGTRNDRAEDRHTAISLASIRKHLPDAEIILSTWKGNDVSGLPYDVLVKSDDPGTFLTADFYTNAVRQVVSSQEGLKRATRRYALKIRSDIVLKHGGFLQYFEEYNNLPFDAAHKIVEKRVALLTPCNPRRRFKFPYNASDWFYFGLTEDLKKIFDAPHIPSGNKTPYFNKDHKEERMIDIPYSSEQYIWFSFLSKYRDIKFAGMDDVGNGTIENSERYFANNAILLTARMAGIDWLKYPGAAYAQIPCLSNSGLYTWNEYKRMLNTYANNHLAIIPNPLEVFTYATVYPFRFWLREHNRFLYNRIIRLVNGENHRRVAENEKRANGITPDSEIKKELRRNAAKFNKVVIWGLRKKWHTHRFIFQAYYETLKKCGVPVLWVEDEAESARFVEPNDIIFSAGGMYGKMVPEKKSLADYHVPIHDDVFYCLHEEYDFFLEKINKEKSVKLKYYNNDAEKFPKIREAVHWDSDERMLYQPWGTNLLPEEFEKPTYNRHRFLFWVGSIWNDAKNQGNIHEIAALKRVLKRAHIRFIHVRFIPNFLNTLFVRLSRIAPAIGGRKQVDINYLPCRMFKNISYGQLGFSNIRKFNDIFKDCNVYDEDMETMVQKVLDLPKEEYLRLIEKQQQICKSYTIAHHLNNIFMQF